MVLSRRALLAVLTASAGSLILLSLRFADVSGGPISTRPSPSWAVLLGAFGGPVVLPVLTLAVAGVLAAVGRGRQGAFVILAVGGAGLATYMLKVGLQVLGADHNGGRLSDFPSGHEAATVAFAGALALLSWSLMRLTAARIALACFVVVAAGLMGWGRVAIGAHTTLDVVGGAVVGIGWLAACLLLLPPERPAAR